MDSPTSPRLGVDFSRSRAAGQLQMEILLIQAPSKTTHDAYNPPCKA